MSWHLAQFQVVEGSGPQGQEPKAPATKPTAEPNSLLDDLKKIEAAGLSNYDPTAITTELLDSFKGWAIGAARPQCH